MFHEICIYEAKLDKQDEIEQLMQDVAAFYKEQDGVVRVTYIKRTWGEIKPVTLKPDRSNAYNRMKQKRRWGSVTQTV